MFLTCFNDKCHPASKKKPSPPVICFPFRVFFHDAFFSSNHSFQPLQRRPFSSTCSTVSFGTALASCEGDVWPKAFLLWEKLRSNTLQVSQASRSGDDPKKKRKSACRDFWMETWHWIPYHCLGN